MLKCKSKGKPTSFLADASSSRAPRTLSTWFVVLLFKSSNFELYHESIS